VLLLLLFSISISIAPFFDFSRVVGAWSSSHSNSNKQEKTGNIATRNSGQWGFGGFICFYAVADI
jgi:hypothetical protein